MTSPILVVPFVEDLVRRVRQHPLIMRLNDERDIEAALSAVSRLRLTLHALWVETPTPLCAIEPRKQWADAAISLLVPSAGRYQDLRRRIPLFRQPGLRVYLPATTEENILAARILASLGVQTAIVLKGSGVLWKPLQGLMTYALLGMAPRASIEPFNYIASSWSGENSLDYSVVYFDDPRVYLHVDDNGRIALTADDARLEQFAAGSIDMLAKLEQSPAFVARAKAWQASFTRRADDCASCEGWPICRGKFAEQARRDTACREFFVEMTNVVARSRTQREHERHSWQP